MNLSNSSKINRRQATGKSTFRKCPECKVNIRTKHDTRFYPHSGCPTAGYSPSEWKAAKEKAQETAIQKSINENSWWAKEGL